MTKRTLNGKGGPRVSVSIERETGRRLNARCGPCTMPLFGRDALAPLRPGAHESSISPTSLRKDHEHDVQAHPAVSHG